MNITAVSAEDIFLWPDGVWCFRSDLSEYQYKSDDFEVVPFETPRWFQISAEENV